VQIGQFMFARETGGRVTRIYRAITVSQGLAPGTQRTLSGSDSPMTIGVRFNSGKEAIIRKPSIKPS